MNMSEIKGLSFEERSAHYLKERELLARALKSEVSFLGSPLPLRMGLTLVGGCTGRGKSTTSANLLADFYARYPNRVALAITNEELSSDVLDRVSCILLGVDFFSYREGRTTQEIIDTVQEKSFEVMQRIIVMSTQGQDMSCLEDVMDLLEKAIEHEIDLIVVDYLQTIVWSRNNPGLNQYEVSKRFGLFLKDFGRRVKVPTVLFAQLKPLSTREAQEGIIPDFTSRVQGDQTFINHAVLVLEILADVANKQTNFYVHKDRFGRMVNKTFSFTWANGILSRLSL